MPRLLDSARLVFELQRSYQITQSFAGLLNPEAIAQCVTDGTIAQFGCAFARIWLVSTERTELRLVASSGLYTHTNGSFSRVPMGAFKVGKIAQNGIPFLSNNLPEESWVKDRDWAIANGILGFAGYPLVADGQAIGVLAVFSQQALAPEFLEVLQGLCSSVAVALTTALHYQDERQTLSSLTVVDAKAVLSERLARLLTGTRLTMVGTEREISPTQDYVLSAAAEVLNRFDCNYCRLSYKPEAIALEAIVGIRTTADGRSPLIPDVATAFEPLMVAIHSLGGTLDLQAGRQHAVMQLSLTLPSIEKDRGVSVSIHCQHEALQLAFTQLAYLAGVSVTPTSTPETIVLADTVEGLGSCHSLLWIQHRPCVIPETAKGCLPLSVTPLQLSQAIDTVLRGETWNLEHSATSNITISERELEIAGLLANGLRDREIARQLHISESTVKFHLNKASTKLQARTRYQLLHQLTAQGWL